MYAKLLKEGREKKEYSMDELMEILKKKYGISMTKMNYSRYESETKQPKKLDYLFLEKVFIVLDLDTSILPHRNDSGETETEKLKRENLELRQELKKLTSELLDLYRLKFSEVRGSTNAG